MKKRLIRVAENNEVKVSNVKFEFSADWIDFTAAYCAGYASVYGVALYVFVEETSANGKAKITRLSSEIVGCQCVDDQSK